MRNDSRNLLARLDRADFAYRDFQAADATRAEVQQLWPLLDLVFQATIGERIAAAAPPAPPPPPPPPEQVTAETAFFNHYGAAPRAPVQPVAEPVPTPAPAMQDLSSLLKSYSGRR